VRRAQGNSSEARAALSELCEAYYKPVFAFLRATRRSEEEARELAQEFFARVLARASVSGADPERGKFRSFLLGAVKHFLDDLRDRSNAAKRGGGVEHVPIETGSDTSAGTDVPGVESVPEDAQFDREWALTLLARGIEAVEGELREAGKAEIFAVLKPWLTGESAALSLAGAAKELGMNEGAVKVAIHRLRQRFRAAVRAEIAQTVDGEEAIASEMSYLVSVLTR
jgi:RNA polymerase sigma-70 factor (ECF subfamily)